MKPRKEINYEQLEEIGRPTVDDIYNALQSCLNEDKFKYSELDQKIWAVVTHNEVITKDVTYKEASDVIKKYPALSRVLVTSDVANKMLAGLNTSIK